MVCKCFYAVYFNIRYDVEEIYVEFRFFQELLRMLLIGDEIIFDFCVYFCNGSIFFNSIIVF